MRTKTFYLYIFIKIIILYILNPIKKRINPKKVG